MSPELTEKGDVHGSSPPAPARLPCFLALLSLPARAPAGTCFDEAAGKLTRGNHVTVIPRDGAPVRGDITFLDRRERVLLLHPSDTPRERVLTFPMDAVSRIDYSSSDRTPARAVAGGVAGAMVGAGIAAIATNDEPGGGFPNPEGGDGLVILGSALLGGISGIVVGFFIPMVLRSPHSITCTEPGGYGPSR